MSIENIELQGFEIVYRRYTTFVDGNAVIVEGVPYLHDKESDEYFLEPATMQGLFNIVHGDISKAERITALVRRWGNAEIEQPQLALRFVGKGYEYGHTPVSLFARAADRVRELSTSIRNEVFKSNDTEHKHFSPFTSEPRVSSVLPGSLIFNLESPQEGIFPEETEQVLVKESLEVFVDAAEWVATGASKEIPERLQEPKLRAVALRAVDRLLPNSREADAMVELSGELIEDSAASSSKVVLNAEMRTIAREKYTQAVAQLQNGEAVRIIGIVEALGRKSRIGKAQISGLDWEVKRIQAKYDPKDFDLVRSLSLYWAEGILVEIQGVVTRKADGQAQTIDIQFINRAQ